MKDEVYWLAIQQKYWLIPPETIEKTLQELGSMEKFWNTSDSYLSKLGLRDETIKKFSEYKKSIRMDYFERQLEELHRNNIRLIRYIDKDYPASLKSIHWPPRLRPPRVLFQKGSLLDFSSCVAMGGTRSCSDNARREAFNVSEKLAENGYTIVSGLATGVDTEAHKGALEAGGKTVAVLAWMEPVYPPDNITLSEQISRQGAILSECYRRPQSSFKWRFVERNKIISGISKCVIAIETGEKGGTIQLANIALRQGRRVFALEPKGEDEGVKRGYELLLDMGAIPTKSYKEIVDFLENETHLLPKDKRSNSGRQSTLIAFGQR